MAKLADLRAGHPLKDRAEYEKAHAEADLAGRIASMAYGMRVAAGLSQTQLAKRMGTSQPAIARLENAGSIPGIEFMARLAASTGVELSLIAAGVGEVCLSEAATEAAFDKVAAGKTPVKKSAPSTRCRASA